MKALLIALSLAISTSGATALASDKSLHQLPMVFKNDKAKPVKLSDFKGKNVVLTMAYTKCGSTCPMTMKKLKDIQAKLDAKKQQAEFVIATFDSKRDTPEALAEYREMSDLTRENWHFLFGNAKVIRKLSMALGIKYRTNPDNGEIMHDNKIIYLDKNGEVIRTLDNLGAEIEPMFDKQ